MKRISVLLLSLAALFGGNAYGQNLRYDVVYDLAFIHKVAGHAEMNISGEGTSMTGYLNGKSIPWGGRIYCVQDTLIADITAGSEGLPEMHVSYRNGWYTKPEIHALEAGDYDRTNPQNYKTIMGQGELNASNATMEAVTITADMLGLFRSFRDMNFNTLTVGHTYNIPLEIDGAGAQTVALTYLGESNYEYNGVSTPTYKVSFEYSYQGKPSNYPVICQMNRTSRIPLYLTADLAIGRMEMILIDE